MQLFILYESAQGYFLFVKEDYDETGGSLSKVQKASLDLERFSKTTKLVGSQPFKTAEEALENIQNIAAGEITPMLKNFLTTHLPATKSSKKQKFALGISDAKLGPQMFSETGITAIHNDTTTEMIRGIRNHYAKLIDSKYYLTLRKRKFLNHKLLLW
jgi:nucleolar protein 56